MTFCLIYKNYGIHSCSLKSNISDTKINKDGIKNIIMVKERNENSFLTSRGAQWTDLIFLNLSKNLLSYQT